MDCGEGLPRVESCCEVTSIWARWTYEKRVSALDLYLNIAALVVNVELSPQFKAVELLSLANLTWHSSFLGWSDVVENEGVKSA